MFVLHSFMRPAVETLGQEQFLMVYLGGGMLSSLTSYVYKSAILQFGHSLGAVCKSVICFAIIFRNFNRTSFQSGAIMAILAFVCMKYPDTELNIIFLPNFGFSADTV